MKKLLIVLLLFSLVGCTTPQQKQLAAEARVNKAQKQIEKRVSSIEDKGKSFVYGAGLSFDKIPKEIKEPSVEITGKFIDLAELALGPPSFSDARKIQEIVDGLFAQVRAEAELAKAEAAKSKVAELKAKESELRARAEMLESKTEKADVLEQARVAKEQAKNFEEQYKTAEIEAKKAQKEVAAAETKLNQFSGQIVYLEGEIEYLKTQHDLETDKLNKVARDNAAKLEEYKEEYGGFINSVNPFKDFGRGIKKIFGWIAVLLGLYILFRILGVFYPVFGVILDWFTGIFAKGMFKVAGGAKKYAGVVSDSVYKGFKQTVVAIDHTFDKIENPIESEILRPFPNDKLFTKDEVLVLLEQHSDRIKEILKNELKDHQDLHSKALVDRAKVDAGVKNSEKSNDPL